MAPTLRGGAVGRKGARAHSPRVPTQLALIAAEAHADTQPRPDKIAARRHRRSRQVVSRWRIHGEGSPVHGVLVYIEGLSPAEALRVASQVLAAARARALGGKSTNELVALYRAALDREVDHEAEDRKLERPGGEWRARSRASLRDGSTDILLGSIENLFDYRGVSDAEVFGR